MFEQGQRVTGREIDNRKAAMAEPDTRLAIQPDARIIRPAMRQAVAHRVKHCFAIAPEIAIKKST